MSLKPWLFHPPAKSMPRLLAIVEATGKAVMLDEIINYVQSLQRQVKGLPQLLLCRVGFLKQVLLLPALNNGDEKVIGGIACLMSEIGQAVRDISCHKQVCCLSYTRRHL